MIAVLDTNVWISAIINPHGTPAKIASHWRKDNFSAVVTPALMAELRRAVTYPRVQMAMRRPAAEVDAFIEDLARSTLTATTTISPISRDPDDDHLLAAAMGAGADYLVSGDRDLLDLKEIEGVAIVTPARFLAILETTPA